MEYAARLDELRSLELGNIRQPDIFTKIAHLAADMFACQIGLVSIVNCDRVWFLGQAGFSPAELPLQSWWRPDPDQLHCPILVQDTLSDQRFQRNPLVEGQPYIRSILDIPLFSDNRTWLGSLSVLSRSADAFGQADIARLQTIVELAEKSITTHKIERELSKANASLEQFNRLFKQAEKAANIGAWRVDLIRDELTWSDQVYKIHGLDPSTDVDLTNAVDFYDADDREVVSNALIDALDQGRPFNFEANLRRSDGQLRRVRAVGERIDVDGVPDSIAGIFLDCTEEHLANVALKRAAEHDLLTGLFNRSVFDRELTRALKNEEKSPVTIMLLDLDGFKDVNDTLGHLAGDRVLSRVAQRLKRIAGENVFVARWGGDEFAFLFKLGVTIETAIKFSKDVVSDIIEQVQAGDDVITIGGTCGIATLSAGGTNAEIVRRADLALYRGKELGKGTVTCWDEAIDSMQCARQKAINRLRSALANNRVFPAYQPIIDIKSGKTVSFEALLRLEHEDGRVLSAGEVFPALLDPTLSRSVSDKMLGCVFEQGATLQAEFGQNCRIAINISEADLRHGDLAEKISELSKAHALSAENLIIEVTETTLLPDYASTIREILVELDQMGCTIALDDFGTGFSSLTHLRNFPISEVKIDKDFIGSIASDHQSRLIIQAIAQMAQSLGLSIVAEGVEKQEQLDFLTAAGCTHAQGYLLGRPKPLTSMIGRARDAA